MSKEAQAQRKRFQNFITSERKKRTNRGNAENDGDGNNDSNLNPIGNLFRGSNSNSSSSTPTPISSSTSTGSSNPIGSDIPIIIKKWVPNEKIEGICNIIKLLNVKLFLNKFCNL